MLDTPGQVTLSVIAMFVAWKALELLGLKLKDQMGLKSQDGLAVARFVTSCSAHPTHFNQVSEMHGDTKRNRDILESWDDKINQGFFSCKFKDRDEITKMLAAQELRDQELKRLVKDNTEAIKLLTDYMKANGR